MSISGKNKKSRVIAPRNTKKAIVGSAKPPAVFIFISHRHEEEAIATVLCKTFRSWEVPESYIFQSSDSRHSTTIGENLSSELKKAASSSHLFLMVYTHPDFDWSYCFYEMGLATDPQTPDTRISIFQCTDNEPEVAKDLVRVKITLQDIQKFTLQFHQEEGFFLPEGKAYRPDLALDVLQERASKLYKDLKGVVPSSGLKNQYRWDFITVKINSDTLSEINKQGEKLLPHEDLIKKIENNLVLVREFGNAIRHFDYNSLEEGTKFSDLVARWRKAIPDAPTAWIDALYKEIWRAIFNKPAQPGFTYLKSAIPHTDWWFAPIVNHVRVLPQNEVEFDIYFYQHLPPKKEDLKIVPANLLMGIQEGTQEVAN